MERSRGMVEEQEWVNCRSVERVDEGRRTVERMVERKTVVTRRA